MDWFVFILFQISVYALEAVSIYALFFLSGAESFYASLDIVFGRLPPQLFNEYVRSVETSDELIQDSIALSDVIADVYQYLVSARILDSVSQVRNEFVARATRRSDANEASAVSDLLRLYAVLLNDVIVEVHGMVHEELEGEAEQRRLTSIPSALALVFSVMTAVFVLMSGARNMHSLFLYAAFMEKNSRGLKREKRKIDSILQEMLPKTVIYR